MKKLLSIFAISALAVSAFAQGTVNWGSAGGLFISQTNSTFYSSFPFGSFGGSLVGGGVGNTTASVSGLFYYELLVSPSAISAPATMADLSNWQDTGLEAENNINASGRILQLNASTDAVANHWAAGVTENLIMVGWSANLGTTWSDAFSRLQNWGNNVEDYTGLSFFGVGSSVGSLAAFSVNPGVTILGQSPGQINNGASNPMQMDLLPLPVPEPGTLALAGLSGLSFLAFRRKR